MPYGEGRHLAPLAEIVRTACGITDEDEPEVAIERVHRTLARLDTPAPSLLVPGALADRLLYLLGIEHESEASTRDGAPADPLGRDGVLDAAASLLRALAAEGPLLVVIDDLQWASEELLEAIGEVAKRLRGPILLVLVGREPATIADLPSPRQLTLAPMDEAPPTGCCAPTSAAAISPTRCARRCSAGPRAIRTSSPNCCICWSTAACCSARATPGWRPVRCRPTRCRRRCSPCSPPVSTGSTRWRSPCCARPRCWDCASPPKRSASSISAPPTRCRPRSTS